jgi:hypothetical protein
MDPLYNGKPCFLVANPDAPYNLMIRFPAWSDPARIEPDDDLFLEKCISRARKAGTIPADAIVHTAIYPQEIPKDHPCDCECEFFDAWEWASDSVRVNMSKARDIVMGKIRRARNAALVATDVTFVRAVEAGDSVAQAKIAQEKQVLRDIPQTFDLTATTPAQLKTRWPTQLPKTS